MALTLVLTSSAFADGDAIPSRYTCDGEDISPPLAWSGAPDDTKGFALIVDDPDAPDPRAPKMIWVHWVLYNMPGATNGLSEAISASDLAEPAQEGLNDWERTGYRGPCPPIGRHRYFHRLYALDAMLPDLGTPTKAQLEAAMNGHILAQAQLMGTYERAG